MGKSPQVVLQAAGRDVVITNPQKVFFPETGHTKLDLASYYLAVAEGALRGISGRPFVLKRYVDGAGGEPFFQKRAPESRPDWIETVELGVSVGTHRRRSGDPRRGAASVGGQSRLHRSATRTRCGPTISTIRTNCGSTSIPGPASASTTCGASRWSPAKSWSSTECTAGRRPRGRAASTSTCGSSAAGRSTKFGGRPSRWRARSSGARRRLPPASGGRRSATASSSTTTRTPRTARSPRPGRCGRRATRGCRCRSSGARWRTATRRRSHCATVPARLRERGDAARGDRRRAQARSSGCSNCRREQAADGPGGRALAAALSQAGG